jgi:hypothetical protein
MAGVIEERKYENSPGIHFIILSHLYSTFNTLLSTSSGTSFGGVAEETGCGLISSNFGIGFMAGAGSVFAGC